MLVHFLSLWVDVLLLLEGLLFETSSFSLLEHLSFLNEGSLELSWFWVEFVIVVHLLIEVVFLHVGGSKSSKECEILNLSHVLVEANFGWNVDLANLGQLEKGWDREKKRHVRAVLPVSLILENILILEGLFTRVKESEIVKIFMSIGHCLFIKYKYLT